MKKESVEIFELARQAALAAGEILTDNFEKIREVSRKADGSLVTNVDIEAEKRIVGLIKNKFPEHSILTEESPEINEGSEYRWIIDPLDGTHNYVRGIDIFGVSIGIAHMGKPVIGIIYLPATGALYSCEKGSGAYLNGKRIRVSGEKLEHACVTHNSSFRRDRERMLEGFGRLVSEVFNIRMLGSCVVGLGRVAEGKLDADIEYNIKPWDIYAGALIVEEAGGRVTDFSGKPWHMSGGPHIASNGLIHDEIQKLLSDLK